MNNLIRSIALTVATTITGLSPASAQETDNSQEQLVDCALKKAGENSRYVECFEIASGRSLALMELVTEGINLREVTTSYPESDLNTETTARFKDNGSLGEITLKTPSPEDDSQPQYFKMPFDEAGSPLPVELTDAAEDATSTIPDILQCAVEYDKNTSLFEFHDITCSTDINGTQEDFSRVSLAFLIDREPVRHSTSIVTPVLNNSSRALREQFANHIVFRAHLPEETNVVKYQSGKFPVENRHELIWRAPASPE